MKCAFGPEYDGRSRIGGLRAAANALNDGNLTLAMIATVQMCLPDLADDDAVERVASADRMLKAGYDPDQPQSRSHPAGPWMEDAVILRAFNPARRGRRRP